MFWEKAIRRKSKMNFFGRFFGLLFVLLAISGCSSDQNGYSDLFLDGQAVIFWDRSQAGVLDADNIWNGFETHNPDLVATTSDPNLFFFQRSAPAVDRLAFVYSFSGDHSIPVVINNQQNSELEPCREFRSKIFLIKNLRAGINFISFKGDCRQLAIRKISLSKSNEPQNRRLQNGDGFRVALNPGKIRFSFKGISKLRVEVITFNDAGEVRARHTETLHIHFSLLSKKFFWQSTTPFLVTVRCVGKSATVEELAYQSLIRPQPAAPPAASPWQKRNNLRNIFIFLADACQARHLALYGYSRKTGSRIYEFAKDAVVFRNAYASCFTGASVASLFTGLEPENHNFDCYPRKLADDLLVLPEFLKSKGFNTAIFTANANVSIPTGFGQGVDHFATFYNIYLKDGSGKMVDSFTTWLKKTPGPRFAYVHFMEPHFPLIPPPPFRNQFKKIIRPKEATVIRQLTKMKTFSTADVQDVVDDYDSAINYVDSLFGQALDFLKAAGCYDESLVVFLADHGEACYEHKVWGHGHNALEETAHIPLVVKFPRSLSWQGERDEIIQISDIFPTIAEFFPDQNTNFDGRALSLRLNGLPPDPDRMVVARSFPANGAFGIRWKKWYYVVSLSDFREALFNLSADPLHSVANLNPEIKIFLRGRFLSWLRLSGSLRFACDDKPPLSTLGYDSLSNLKTFGYL